MKSLGRARLVSRSRRGKILNEGGPREQGLGHCLGSLEVSHVRVTPGKGD